MCNQNRSLIKAVSLAAGLAVLAMASGLPIYAQEPEPLDAVIIQDNIAPASAFTNEPSDNPLMKMPEEWLSAPPAEAPATSGMSNLPAGIGLEMVSFNTATQQETRTPIADATATWVTSTEAATGGMVDPFSGLLPTLVADEQPVGINSIIGPDTRSRVANTSNFPFRTVVRLNMTFRDGFRSTCSGAIVDDFHVLTAGHCVHSIAHRGWYSDIHVIPGLDGAYMPFSMTKVANAHSYNGWTDYQMTNHDWAVLVLDRNIGRHTGWMGRQTADPSHAIYTGQLVTAGYPSDYCNGSCMATTVNSGRRANTDNHWYLLDTIPGQSGSPVWRVDASNGNQYILTVHTTGSATENHGTRLHQDKYDRMIAWMRDDPKPTDYADLIDDGQHYSGFSSTKIRQGATGFSAWNRIRNNGTAGTGNFRVSYYASSDEVIGAGDHLIGIIEVGPIAPFTARDVRWTGKLPGAIRPGQYWIGWVIDSGGGVSEFEERNNTAVKTGYRLAVVPNTVFLPITIKR